MFRSRTSSLSWALTALCLALPMFGRYASASSEHPRVDGPEVAIGSTKRDFGDVFAGEELEQTFPIRNAGTKPLELSQKSTLGARSMPPGYNTRAAAPLWRPNDPLLIRTVALRPAAPT